MHTLILKSCLNLRMKENDWLISLYDTKLFRYIFGIKILSYTVDIPILDLYPIFGVQTKSVL